MRTWSLAVAVAWVQFCRDRCNRWFCTHYSAGGLERENAYHLGGAKVTMRVLGSLHAGEGAGSHAIAEPDIGHRDALVQSLVRAQFKTSAVPIVQTNNTRQVGPKKGAVGEDAAANDRIPAIIALTKQAFGDRVGKNEAVEAV